jgi:hypothetical protein
MKIEIASTDTDNENHRWLEGCDIREILFWSNSHVNAARLHSFQQIRDDVLNWFSFDRRLSDRKVPPGSENSWTIFQNSRSDKRIGKDPEAFEQN